ncbi:MAG TPA: tetratricopeptide repeat protein [Candidatus Didemnitutus sp.]|nr:tetratricopeptide repeat protein [Candidatus Didemnitutus sp.]
MKSRTKASAPSSSRWIFNPALDLLVGCGAWSLPLLAVMFYLSRSQAIAVSFAFYFLGVFCNQPHYMATIYRAYRTRGDFHKYRFFTVYVSVFVLLTVVVVHLAPGLFPWLLTFYLTWSPWHYTGQNFGIAMMLARRAGAQPSRLDRNFIWWSYFASYAAWFLALHNTGTPSQATLVILPIPAEVARIGIMFFLALYLVAGAFGHLRLVRTVGWSAMAGPLTLFVTQFLWFLLPEVLHETTAMDFPPTYASAGILAFMHCAQYLWITTYYARRESDADSAGTHSFRPWRYYFILIVGGIALFIPGPWIASRVFGHDLVESFFIFAALVNLHHFILDGAIWKLRDGRIARLLLGRNPPAPDHAGAESDDAPVFGWLGGPSAGARALRYGAVIALVAIATVDQTQFWLTLKNSGSPALAIAQIFNPEDTRIYFQRAQQLVAAGRRDEAIATLRQAAAINPRNGPVQQMLGELLYQSGDTAAALAQYDRMADLFRPDLVVLVNSGILASQRGDHAKAKARLEAALRLAPEKLELHLYLAEALEGGGDAPGARREYEAYLEAHRADAGDPRVTPTYLAAALKAGDLDRALSDNVAARTWYERTLELAKSTGQTGAEAAARQRLSVPAPINR